MRFVLYKKKIKGTVRVMLRMYFRITPEVNRDHTGPTFRNGKRLLMTLFRGACYFI